MEFRWAAEGDVAALRDWLQRHPDRINTPSAAAHFTLLYTVVSNSQRADLASLRSGQRHYFDTLRMLCEEFCADVGAPNGGTGNTALHLAAQNGDEDTVRYLLHEQHALLTQNFFGEDPLQLAERSSSEPCRRCAELIREELARRELQQQEATVQRGPLQHSLGELCVYRSDSGGDDGAMVAGADLSPDPRRAQRPVVPALAPCHSERSSGPSGSRGSLVAPRESHTVTSESTAPLSFLDGAAKQPYVVRCLGAGAVLGDAELQIFASVYGNGFSYLKCRDHYEVRGLLPYRFRGVVYYTPVLLLSYSSTASLPCVGQYRALVDLQNINSYAISRRAEYIDPLSGAIIPSLQDDWVCRSLVDFVRVALVQNFEQVAPMVDRASAYAFPSPAPIGLLGTAFDTFQYRHTATAPAYMYNVLQRRDTARLLAYRVLQDLSRFGDGLFSFDMRSHTASGVIPVIRETPKRNVLSTKTRDAYSFTNGYDASAADGGAAQPSPVAPTTLTETEVIFMVRVRLVFRTSGAPPQQGALSYDQLPLVYLLDVVSPDSGEPHTARASLTYACFSGLVEDSRSGLVRRDILAVAPGIQRTNQPPSTTDALYLSSLYELLVFLQKELSAAFHKFLASHKAQRRTPPVVMALHAINPLNTLFKANTAKKCLLCSSRLQCTILLPCRHMPFCLECAAAYKQHCRGTPAATDYFECPVCHQNVRCIEELHL